MVCHDLIHLFDDHNVKDMIYIESVIVHPNYRGSALNLDVFFKVDSSRGYYGLLCEGMVPAGQSQQATGMVPGDYWKPMGCKLVKCLYSYDGYVIPVFFIPPKTSKFLFHQKQKIKYLMILT